MGGAKADVQFILFGDVMTGHQVWFQDKDNHKINFVDNLKKDNIVSYGLSSYGYDARVAPEFRIFTNIDNAIVDPKNFSNHSIPSMSR